MFTMTKIGNCKNIVLVKKHLLPSKDLLDVEKFLWMEPFIIMPISCTIGGPREFC